MDPRVINLVGQRFGRLIVIERAPGQQVVLWRCRCDCGAERVVISANLRKGFTQSCGCLQRERAGNANRRHGWTQTKEYRAWCSMKRRCDNPNVERYPHYGGRGITVCDRWRDSFEAFLQDLGKCPLGMSLDRIDVNGNYTPENCRWATDSQQARNKRPRKKAS